MTKDEILKVLTTLPTEDLEEIQKHSKALLSLSRKDSRETWLTTSILEEIRARGLSYTVPDFFKINSNVAYDGYKQKSEQIEATLQTALGEIRRVDLYAFGRICASVLADYLAEFKELSLDTMLRNVEKLPLALESQFPGYFRSGLLHMLLRPQQTWVE